MGQRSLTIEVLRWRTESFTLFLVPGINTGVILKHLNTQSQGLTKKRSVVYSICGTKERKEAWNVLRWWSSQFVCPPFFRLFSLLRSSQANIFFRKGGSCE